MAVGTQRAAERSGHVGDVPTSSLEIIGMAKDAVLALRYRLPDGQVCYYPAVVRDHQY